MDYQFETLQCQEHAIREHLFFYMYGFIHHENYAKIGIIFCINLRIMRFHLRNSININNKQLAHALVEILFRSIIILQ